MGLDMYLSKKEFSEVAYWRKANAIHGWLVNNTREIQEDVIYDVTIDNLITLRDTCKDVIAAHSKDLAMELLPPTPGFFFGSSEIDEWYWKDLEDTVTKLSEIIEHNNEDSTFEYYASW